MKLRSLEIDQFRKFGHPVRIDGIADGLNVLCGPNEMGKSTILAALHGVLFEKYRSRAQPVQEMRSGSNTTSPVVTLEFEIAGARYSITKKFLGRDASARLVMPDGRVIEGDPAEEELQKLLHFGEAGPRGANHDSLGMWGILWVRQGQSFAMPEFAASAQGAVQAALEAEVGVLTGGARGRALPAVIDEELAELVGKRGDPRGRYKQVTDDLAAVESALRELKEKERRLAADVEALGTKERELKWLLADSVGEEESRRLLAEAKRRRDEILELQGKIREAETQAKLAETVVEAAHGALNARRSVSSAAEQARERLAALSSAAEAAEAAEADAAVAADVQRGTVGILEEQSRESAERVRTLRKRHEASLLAERLAVCEARHAKAMAAQVRVDALALQAAEIPVTPEHVQTIRKALAARESAVAALNAVATDVSFGIMPAELDKITVDGKPLADPKATMKAAAELTIGIAGIGKIAVRPLIKDAKLLLQNREKAERGLADALAAAAVTSLEQAERRLEEKRSLTSQLELARREVDLHTPGDTGTKPGLAALAEYIASLRSALAAALAALGLSDAPDRRGVEAALEAADAEEQRVGTALAIARAALAEPENRLAEAREALARANTEQETACDRLRELMRDLAAATAQVPEADLELAVSGAEQAYRRAVEAVTALRASDLEPLDVIEARMDRLTRRLDGRKEQIHELQIETVRLRTAIQAQEGDGIEEKIRRAEREGGQLERECAFFEREVKVLTLLRGTLKAAEQEARERYLAPIVRRIQPYLNMLFPGSTVRVDEDFHITGVVRNGDTEEEFARLSDGTREQIAVLARLALAELLLEQGRPATVILDDALVFSDDDRLDRMFDILNAAARKTQVVVLSCRKRLFDGLGGTRLRIEEARMRDFAAE